MNKISNPMLYGWKGEPYKELIGKPLYKVTRKTNLSEWASLAVANIPGSAIHACIGITNPWLYGSIFLLSELVFTSIMYSRHIRNKKQRQTPRSINSRLESNLSPT